MVTHEHMPFGIESEERRKRALSQAAASKLERERAHDDLSELLVKRIPEFANEAVQNAKSRYEHGLGLSGFSYISNGSDRIDKKILFMLQKETITYRHPDYPSWRFIVLRIDTDDSVGEYDVYQMYAYLPAE